MELGSYDGCVQALLGADALELGLCEFYSELFFYTDSYRRYGTRFEVPVTLSTGGCDGQGTWRSVALADLPLVVEGRNDAYISACTYFPKKCSDGRWHSTNGAKRARELCSFVLDIDNVGGDSLAAALDLWSNDDGSIGPTYVVCSGNGVHLYYALSEPVQMLQRWQDELTAINRFLYSLFQGVDGDDAAGKVRLGIIDQHGLTQPYRVPGSLSKDDKNVVTAWRVGNPRSVTELAIEAGLEQTVFEIEEFDMASSLRSQRFEQNRALAEAHRSSNPGKKRRGWTPGFYEWLLCEVTRKSKFYGQYGHRYKQAVALSIVAAKDRIPRKKLVGDLEDLCESWNECAKIYGHPAILWSECSKAIKMYDQRGRKKIVKYPRWWLEELVGFEFGPPQTRKYRSQKTYLKDHNETLKRRGRIQSLDKLLTYFENNPNGSKRGASREMGMSLRTVSKYWDRARILAGLDSDKD